MTTSQDSSPAVSRRVVVAAVGGVGLTAALTACGGTDAADTAVGRPTDSPGGGGAGTELAKVTDIPEGGGKVVGDVVITQPRAGEFKAFSSKCTHQGCLVKDVTDNLIHCPCHDSRFDAGDGSVRSGPATAPLPPASITVEGGLIKLA
ncbi:Rieske (2Fe-2S) protein [Streptomyces sp. NPDC005953]|uniref:Rieske (2Fe-2S) protein n=1 Tax=unclassified Streptomyces TaxID=2593676 RepID=UPI00340C1C2C